MLKERGVDSHKRKPNKNKWRKKKHYKKIKKIKIK